MLFRLEDKKELHKEVKSQELWKYLYIKLRDKRFKRLCHAQYDLDVFVKLTVQLENCIRKTTSAHYDSGVGDFIQRLSFFIIS